jgi:uncharacterized protein DUF6962
MTEIATLVTDYALGALSLWWSARLRRQAKSSGQRSTFNWSFAFAALALASFGGGTYHGFSAAWSARSLAALWVLVSWAMAAASFFLLWGTALATTRGRARTVWLGIALLGALGFGGLALASDDYRLAIADYGSSMVAACALALLAWRRERSPSAPWIAAGVLVSACAAAVQQSDFGLTERFNHNDVYHVIQALGLYLLYCGARRLRDASEP